MRIEKLNGIDKKCEELAKRYDYMGLPVTRASC